MNHLGNMDLFLKETGGFPFLSTCYLIREGEWSLLIVCEREATLRPGNHPHTVMHACCRKQL